MSVERNVENSRQLTYTQAVREALFQAMKKDSSICILGQGINDDIGVFGTTTDLYKQFGEERTIETPLAEAGMMGIAAGMALNGLKPIYFHIRVDFLMLTMDQIVNHISKFSYMSGGQCNVPMVIWAATGKGWGSGAQHSQALQGLFMHIPGLKIVMPSNPFDAKGLMLTAIEDKNPVLILEHRDNFNQKAYVPENMYKIPFGQGRLCIEGKDITIIAISEMVLQAIKAAEKLKNKGISVEVIDLRTLNPLDKDIMIKSALKTKRVIIADTGWKTDGVSAELSSIIYDNLYDKLLCKIERIALPDIPTPASYSLERAFYKGEQDICLVAERMMEESCSENDRFK